MDDAKERRQETCRRRQLRYRVISYQRDLVGQDRQDRAGVRTAHRGMTAIQGQDSGTNPSVSDRGGGADNEY